MPAKRRRPRTFPVTIEGDYLRSRIKQVAKERGVSVDEVVNLCIEAALDRIREQGGWLGPDLKWHHVKRR